ncbi:membrane protein insertion efficiency factor YidD [Pelagibacteraceae bacterium]|nr:membrane protein insertion efficiency factor YidD [Pelagibacteraceae bacterium]
MSKLIIFSIVNIIKLYKYFVSPIIGNRCRYLPTCSDYFIEALNVHGVIKGLYIGIKRILSCHPLKILGGGSGLDLVPNKKVLLRGKLNGK